MAMTLSGPVTATGVNIAGDVTASSMTVSSITIANELNTSGAVLQIKGRVLQMQFSSTTVNTVVTATTWTAVSNLSHSITLKNANDYVRISLTGNLSNEDAMGYKPAYITIYRDSINLGDSNSGLLAATWISSLPAGLASYAVGITLTDSPQDTSSHTYQPYILATSGGSAIFPNNGSPTLVPAVLLLEEVAQ